MVTAIHQPHYFPWLGYLDKMAKAGQFIILDEVQLTDRSPMVRNKFLTFSGAEEMLSLSVKKKGYRDKKTRDIELFDIENIEIQMDTVFLMRELFGIKTEIIYQSQLQYDRENKKSGLIQAICSAVGTDIYLSGNGARKYMDVPEFKKAGIEVVYQDFTYPVYRQFDLEAFVPNLSALDILFHLGAEEAKCIFWENVRKGKEFQG